MTATAAFVEYVSTGPKTWDELSTWMKKKGTIPVSTGWTWDRASTVCASTRACPERSLNDTQLQQIAIDHLQPYKSKTGHFHNAWYSACFINVMSSSPRSESRAGAFVFRYQDVTQTSCVLAAVCIGRVDWEGLHYFPRKWVDQCLITAYVSRTLLHTYPGKPEENNEEDQVLKTRQGGDVRRTNNGEDRKSGLNELAKQSHPLNDIIGKLYNIVRGRLASEQVSITDAGYVVGFDHGLPCRVKNMARGTQ